MYVFLGSRAIFDGCTANCRKGTCREAPVKSDPRNVTDDEISDSAKKRLEFYDFPIILTFHNHFLCSHLRKLSDQLVMLNQTNDSFW